MGLNVMNKYLLVFMLAVGFLTTRLANSGFAQTKANSRTEAYYHFSKARMLDDQGQSAQAIDEYKKALELDPNNSLIFSEMAESYLRNNRLREAVDVAQKAIQADRDNIEAHKLLTTVYLQVIGRASAQQPPSTETINNAIHEFEEIVRIDPTERQSFLMLGRLYQIKGDRAKAEQAGGTFVAQQAIRDGRIVTGQTWQSHPEFYREVFACLAPEVHAARS